MKICRACGIEKDLETGFYKTSGNTCRDCHNAKSKEWRENNVYHLARIQREWREANEGHVYTDKKSGYEIYIGYNHPAALPCGVTRYHRIVLWEKIGGGEHPCNWCGKTVYWNQSTHTDWHTALIVDHVDWDKTNNDPSNLVPACNDCNLSTSRRRKFGKIEGGENNETN